MTRTRESLDYDTWLQQRAALTDDDRACSTCGHGFSEHYGKESCLASCDCDGFREPDDNVPDDAADTDPDCN